MRDGSGSRRSIRAIPASCRIRSARRSSSATRRRSRRCPASRRVGPAELALTLGAALLIGSLIGSVGIGGVLLVPWLTGVIGLGVRDAVTIAMASYLATGVVAILQARF